MKQAEDKLPNGSGADAPSLFSFRRRTRNEDARISVGIEKSWRAEVLKQVAA
jgi:hypothetical protein